MLRTLGTFLSCLLLIGVVQSLCSSLHFLYYKEEKQGGGEGKTIFFSCPNEHMFGSMYCVKPQHSSCALLCMSFLMFPYASYILLSYLTSLTYSLRSLSLSSA